jgi:hypothetical protein
MVGRDVLVCHHRCFPILIQQWDLFICYGLIGHGGGGGRRSSFALHTDNTLRSGRWDIVDNIGDLVSFARHGGVEGGEVQQMMNESRRF